MTRKGATANYIYMENHSSQINNNNKWKLRRHLAFPTLTLKPSASFRTERSGRILPSMRYPIRPWTGPDIRLPANRNPTRGALRASGPFSPKHPTPKSKPKPSPAISLQRPCRFPCRIHAGPESQRTTMMTRDVSGWEGAPDRHDQTGASSMCKRYLEKPTPADVPH